MSNSHHDAVEQFMSGLRKRNPHQAEFHQAVQELAETVMPYILEHPNYESNQVLQRLTEPDRIITFRVTWVDDDGSIRANRGYRVQFNNAIGPYKGGLRFHPSVNESILKFLGFEQIFKNALTGLPMGGAKGGANFNPKGKSDGEVMRFCQSFMLELSKHIGPSLDVPAGDIGVGGREIGYLFGQYKRISGEWTGTLTGKGLGYGGSLIRTEATGYGCCYFVQEMLNANGESFEGKKVLISGSGNVAQYAAQKANEYGATVLTMSDSGGTIYDKEGIRGEKLEFLFDLKQNRRGRISEYATKYGAEYLEGQRPWSVPADVALPCATQNELSMDDAKTLMANGVKAVGEGANMPTELSAVHAFVAAGVLFGPAKAANAGGVACSGLEQSQNALRVYWTRDEVDGRLRQIMKEIHEQCVEFGKDGDSVNYVKGANVAGFQKVGRAMIAHGVV